MKRCMWIFLCATICVQLAGCSGWKVRTSTLRQERVDQEIVGNRGFISGQPTQAPQEPTFTDRKVYRLEVEIPQWKKKKAQVKEEKSVAKRKETAVRPAKEDNAIWGNRGYLTGSATQEAAQEISAIDVASQEQKTPLAKIREKIFPPKEEAAEMRTYQVRKGDTLQKISHKFYGTTKKWTLLYQANRNKLKDPDHVYPGQVLVIPEVSEFKK